MGMLDLGYKDFYSDGEIVEEIVRVLTRERHGKRTRYRLLQRGSEGFVNQKLRKSRLADMVWLYEVEGYRGAVVLEFTSTVDPEMPGRMMQYTARAWRSLEREFRRTGYERLPLLTPVVIYNGEKPWTVPQWTGEGLPRGLRNLIPLVWYMLIDVLHDPLERWEGCPLMTYALRLERAAEATGALGLLAELQRYLKSAGLSHLDRSFARLAARVFFKGELSAEELLAMSELKQVNTRLQNMLARSREEGERRALRAGVETVLEARFGAVPGWARKRIKGASEDELHRWLRRAVTAPSLEAVFEKD